MHHPLPLPHDDQLKTCAQMLREMEDSGACQFPNAYRQLARRVQTVMRQAEPGVLTMATRTGCSVLAELAENVLFEQQRRLPVGPLAHRERAQRAYDALIGRLTARG